MKGKTYTHGNLKGKIYTLLIGPCCSYILFNEPLLTLSVYHSYCHI